MGRFATRALILSALLLAALPCLGQPPGVLYSTTVPYSPQSTSSGLEPTLPSVSAITTASGNSYVAGAVYANGLPSTPGAVQPAYTFGVCADFFEDPMFTCPDAFIARFDSNGMLQFLTYLGGTGKDVPNFLGVDALGNIYVAGQTDSTDFPLAGTPWRPVLTSEGIFVAKLSGNGKTLIWSTVLNGTLLQLSIAPNGTVYYLAQITVESDGRVTVTVALTKLTESGQFISTTNLPSETQALAIGTDGSVYIGGLTAIGSDVTPTPGAWQTTYNGGWDGFVAQMSPSLSGFTWLTFVGGSETDPEADDNVTLIQPAPDGSLWITGDTNESDFPVLPGAWQAQSSPGSGFLVHVSADGSKALAATYLPAALSTLALDGAGNVIFSALDGSGFHATPGTPWPCMQAVAGPPGGFDTGFFGKIDAAGQHHLFQQLILANIRPNVTYNLSRRQQQAVPQPVHANVIADGRQILRSLPHQRPNEILRNPAQSKPANHDDGAVAHIANRRIRIRHNLIHSAGILNEMNRAGPVNTPSHPERAFAIAMRKQSAVEGSL